MSADDTPGKMGSVPQLCANADALLDHAALMELQVYTPGKYIFKPQSEERLEISLWSGLLKNDFFYTNLCLKNRKNNFFGKNIKRYIHFIKTLFLKEL